MSAIPPVFVESPCPCAWRGSRYDFYPPAEHFQHSFGEAAFRQAASVSNEDPIPRRLTLSVRLPRCSGNCSTFPGKRNLAHDDTRADRYLAHLEREMAMAATLFYRDREVVQLHLDGNATDFLGTGRLGELMENLHRHFQAGVATDLAIEIDPQSVSSDDIEALAFMGFNRAHIRAQDICPGVRLATDSLQPVHAYTATIEALRRERFRSVTVAVMHGLPGQKREGFARFLDGVLAARPDRVAIRDYPPLPQGFRSHGRLGEPGLSSGHDRLGLLLLAIGKLAAAGYRCIGMGEFCLPTDELALAQERGCLYRNLTGYTVLGETDQIGFGIGAISRIGDNYAQNLSDPASWEAAIDGGRLPVWRGLRLGGDDVLRSELIQQLMCYGRIEKRVLETRHRIDFDEYFAEDLRRLQPLASAGLVECAADSIRARDDGRLLHWLVAACFDAYLQREDRKTRWLSRAARIAAMRPDLDQ